MSPALVMSEARDVALQLNSSIPRTIADVTHDVGTHPIVNTMQAVFARRFAGIERVVAEL